MTLLRLAFAGCLLLSAAGLPAAGTKNFEPPASVPNYFSNEAGPFRGGAGAETTYSSSGPAVVRAPPRERVAAAPGRSVRHHAARAGHRVRHAHAHHRSSRHVARVRTSKSKIAALHHTRRAHAKAAASRRAATKIAAAKRSAAKRSTAKKHRAGTKHRPASKRVAHTASR